MTKVWKRTGAIAVYSPARATAVVVVAVLAVVGLGFVAGLAAGDDGGEQVTAGAAGAPPASVPQQPAAAAAAADPGPEADGEAADVAYRRGYRKGLRRGSRRAKATAPAGLRPNGAYFVRVSRSGGSLSHRTQIEQGATYWLCAGGSRLCMRGGGG